MDESEDIIQQYFEKMAQCFSLNCQKVIFEPTSKIEWFFDNDSWCYFEFQCEDEYYSLKTDDNKNFDDNCFIKEMSYEIRMLLAYSRLRNVKSIEKQMFADYVNDFEQEKIVNPTISIEKFNFDIKEKESEALKHADKIANRIMGGCLLVAVLVAVLCLFTVFSYIKTKYF